MKVSKVTSESLNITMEGGIVEQVKRFRYLGVLDYRGPKMRDGGESCDSND